MRTKLLLIISCCLLLLGGQKAYPDSSLVSFSKNFQSHHAAETTQLKKTSLVVHEQSDLFTEIDEDLNFSKHLELQVKDLLVFSLALVWTSRPFFIKMPLPFSWLSVAVSPSKYILQRVLRI